jgi:hypothetical protein
LLVPGSGFQGSDVRFTVQGSVHGSGFGSRF